VQENAQEGGKVKGFFLSDDNDPHTPTAFLSLWFTTAIGLHG
jgi:hypothetical protein